MLEAQLAVVANEQQKIDALNDLAYELRHSDLQRAISLSQMAHELTSIGQFFGQPYQKGRAYSLRNLGWLNFQLGKYDLALSFSFEALDLFEAIDDLAGQFTVFYAIGGSYYNLGDYPNALDCQLKAIEICDTIGDRWGKAISLNNMGIIYGQLGDYAQALAAYQKALQINAEIDDKYGEANTLNNLSIGYCQSDDYANALDCGRKSLQLAQEIGHKALETSVLDTLGTAYLGLNNIQQALTCFEQSVAMARKIGHQHYEMEALLNIGQVFHQQKQADTALTYIEQVVSLAEKAEAKKLLFESHQLLAEIYKSQGDFERALSHYEQFFTIKETVLNEKTHNKLKSLQVIHDTETAKKEAEIYRLKNVALEQEIAERRRIEAEREKLITELQEALIQVKRLSGLLPICANCKKIRDDEGYWQDVAVYIREHSEADFTHGICPNCVKELYPDLDIKLDIDLN